MAIKRSQVRTQIRRKAPTAGKAIARTTDGLQSRPFATPDEGQESSIAEPKIQTKPLSLGSSFAKSLPLTTVAQSTSLLQRRQSDRLGPDQNTASATVEKQVTQAQSGGQQLPTTLRRSMEGAFKQDFSGVKIHTDDRADVLNRSMQAQAFTTNNHIFFKKDNFQPNTRQGQELIAHELTHVAQQKSNTIQRKKKNIENLKQETIHSSFFGTSESKKMQQLVDQYNEIADTDFKYGLQIELLDQIHNVAMAWIKKYDKDNDTVVAYKATTPATLARYMNTLDVKEKDRAEDIGLLIINVHNEKAEVNKQIQSYNPAANPQNTPTINSGREVGKAAEVGAEVYDQVGEIGMGVKDSYDGVQDVIKSAKEGAQAVLTGMQEQGESGLETALKVLGGGLQGLTDILSGTLKNIVEMVTGIITSITKVVVSYKEKKALKESYDAAVDKSNTELADVTLHAFNKVRRRFGMACLEFGKSLLTTIGKIIGLFGCPMVTVVTETIGKVVEFGSLVVRKVKGVYKQIKGTRGVAREKDATVIIGQALKGDDNALTLLVRLNPMSFGLKEFFSSLNPISVGFKKLMYSNKIADSDLPGSDVNASNKLKLHNLLKKLNETGNSQDFSMKKFIDLTAEKFKSFA